MQISNGKHGIKYLIEVFLSRNSEQQTGHS